MPKLNLYYFLSIGLGAFLGASGRYLVTLLMASRFSHYSFPLATLSVNILGSFALGLISGNWSGQFLGDLRVRHFLITGFCGSFTTFSAFSMDSFYLYKNGQQTIVYLYIILSVTLSIASFVFGQWLTQKFALR